METSLGYFINPLLSAQAATPPPEAIFFYLLEILEPWSKTMRPPRSPNDLPPPDGDEPETTTAEEAGELLPDEHAAAESAAQSRQGAAASPLSELCWGMHKGVGVAYATVRNTHICTARRRQAKTFPCGAISWPVTIKRAEPVRLDDVQIDPNDPRIEMRSVLTAEPLESPARPQPELWFSVKARDYGAPLILRR